MTIANNNYLEKTVILLYYLKNTIRVLQLSELSQYQQKPLSVTFTFSLIYFSIVPQLKNKVNLKDAVSLLTFYLHQCSYQQKKNEVY